MASDRDMAIQEVRVEEQAMGSKYPDSFIERAWPRQIDLRERAIKNERELAEANRSCSQLADGVVKYKSERDEAVRLLELAYAPMTNAANWYTARNAFLRELKGATR